MHKQLKALRQEVERLKSAPPVTPVEQTTTQHTPLSHTLTNTQKTAHPAPTITSAPTIPTTPSQEFNKPLATELMAAKQTHANAATQEHPTVNAQKHSASSVNPVQVNRQKLKKHQFPLKNKNTHHTPSSAQTTPSSAQTLLHSIWTWFSTGNPMLKIGVAILFLGLAFLL